MVKVSPENNIDCPFGELGLIDVLSKKGNNSTSLSLSQICEWIASLHGKMSINSLEKKINEIFGTRIPASKLAAKLKSSGSWDKVVTDSMDAYIDSLVDAGLSDVDVDDLFREEFF